MTPWVPRQRHPDEPACWSWPVPPLRDMDEEMERALRADLRLHPDQAFGPISILRMYRDPAAARWREFHTGERGMNGDVRCAICGTAGHGELVRIVDDHDHWTGIVRGRCCRGCNVREGSAYGDAPEVAAYRRYPPALILGYREFYSGRGWEYAWWEDEAMARWLTGNPGWTLDGVKLGYDAAERAAAEQRAAAKRRSPGAANARGML